jgi:hypothetical protein
MRAHGDSAKEPPGTESGETPSLPHRLAAYWPTDDEPRDGPALGPHRSASRFLQRLIPVLLRALSAWPA